MLWDAGKLWALSSIMLRETCLGPSAAKSNTKVSKSNVMRLVKHNAKEDGPTKSVAKSNA